MNVALSLIIAGIVQVMKYVPGLNKLDWRLRPVASMGIGVGLAYFVVPENFVIVGALAGLIASGGYDVIKGLLGLVTTNNKTGG